MMTSPEFDIETHGVVLVVEDEPRLVRLIETLLTSIGHQVITAADGQTAIELAAVETPSLIILDLRLPGAIDGYTVCQRVREFSMVPIIMLTARTLEEEKLRGFALGADDYITKPFSAKELLARVRAVLRRSQVPSSSPGRLQVDDLTIDLANYHVSIAGEEIALTPTEYRLLMKLARHPNQVIQHEDLLTDVWGADYRAEVSYLRTYIRYLRQKLEPDPARPKYIRNRPGIGYYLATTD